jgi:hypothetical protein
MKAPLLLAAFGLAACDAPAADRKAPTLTFPLAVPASASPIMADFIAVCSAAMESQARGAGVLGQRAGWTMDGSAVAMGTTGTIAAANEAAGFVIVISSANFPHADLLSCSMNSMRLRDEGEARAFSLATFAELEGFEGSAATLLSGPDGDAAATARYSGVAPNGDLVLLRADLALRFDTLNMSRMTPRIPEPRS